LRGHGVKFLENRDRVVNHAIKIAFSFSPDRPTDGSAGGALTTPRYLIRHIPHPPPSKHVTQWDEGRQRSLLDELAVEEPLEIRVNDGAAGITMRTPGDDFDLAAGFLFTEGIATERDQIIRIRYAADSDGQPSANRVDVTLSSDTR